MKIIDLVLGLRVKADHPVTVLNPEETFIVKYVEKRGEKIYVRGQRTMWFNEELVELVPSAKVSSSERMLRPSKEEEK